MNCTLCKADLIKGNVNHITYIQQPKYFQIQYLKQL